MDLRLMSLKPGDLVVVDCLYNANGDVLIELDGKVVATVISSPVKNTNLSFAPDTYQTMFVVVKGLLGIVWLSQATWCST